MTPFKFRVVPCRRRLFPTLISRMKWYGSELPLTVRGSLIKSMKLKTISSEAQSKSYSLQLLRGLAFIHSQNIIHRDLKPSNLLISPTRRLKIADFGLARLQDDIRPMSHQVATRWYRAPELLYGARRYNYAVDMWSAGTIIGELLTFSPLFPGHSGSISKNFVTTD